jgi:thiol:disulfide interchange protein/DsbC/DsbD-like thiol-disulfide interchange protein
MRKNNRIIHLLFFICLSFFQMKTEALHSQGQDPVTAKLVSEVATIQPDQKFWVLVEFHLAEGWHIYWKNPGDAGRAPIITWHLPDGFQAGDPLFPTPTRFQVGDLVGFGYAEECSLLVPITAPSTIQEKENYTLQADVSWVVCKELCIPGKASLQTAIQGGRGSTINEEAESLFQVARRRLPHENGSYTVQLKDETLEIKVYNQDAAFNDIQSVVLFPETADLVDIKALPVWKTTQNGKNLSVKIKTITSNFPKSLFKGLLVISFTPESLQRDLSLIIEKEIDTTKFGSEKESQEVLQGSKVWLERQFGHFITLFGSEFGYILFLAFLGGMLLNIMPCVLPIVSLKILHFVQLQGQRRGQTFKHGLAFSCGVILSFWLLAFTIYGLQMLGKTVGWGFQLQEPLFVTVLIIVLFALSLSLFGVFEFGTKIASLAAELEDSARDIRPLEMPRPSTLASFWSGVLATFVATPCTGPLLGSTIGFAATLDPMYSLAVFTCLGFGMAFPYLVLSFFPALLKFMPKPGRWMVTFKQLMGFFMLATVIWLIWVLVAETNDLSMLALFAALFLISFGFWIYGTWASFDRGKVTRAFAKIIAFLVIVSGCYVLLSEVNEAKSRPKGQVAKSLSTSEWEPFSEERLAELRCKGSLVFVDVTAKWCLTCQANSLILELDQVKAVFQQYGVHKMLADWTQNDETITKYLRSLGRNGVPVYAVYGRDPDKGPILLPEVLTPEIIINALKEADEGK